MRRDALKSTVPLSWFSRCKFVKAPLFPILEMCGRIFLLLSWGWSISVAYAQGFAFINPPPANVFPQLSDVPVYVEGATIELIWSASASFGPVTIALRAMQDGILLPSSGINENIICTVQPFCSHSIVDSSRMLIFDNSKLGWQQYTMAGTIQPRPLTIPNLLPRCYRI